MPHLQGVLVLKHNAMKPQQPEDSGSTGMTTVVGIATCGRAQILLDVLADLHRQTKPPLRTIVAYVEAADIANGENCFPHIQFIRSARGSCRQRNTIIDAAKDCHVLLFLDDDFYLHSRYIESIESVFGNDPSVVAVTGEVLSDGIKGPGLGTAEAKELLGNLTETSIAQVITPVFNTYGCNMSFRMETVHQHRLRFDERLPLYGWFEDVEFSRQLSPYGKIVHLSGAYGVHLGAKIGRTSGVRLGYSQVANPIYLAKKGTLKWSDAFQRIITRLMKNLLKSLSPEPYLDRRGRLRGNLKGVRDLLLGSLDPTNILEL
jgi:GT2 family glycosyltransferase